jgi:osmotically-inducible protein OsmY
MASYVPEMSGVASVTAMDHVGHGPKGYTRADERILEDVCERLALAPMIDAREISVEVEDGEVALTGEVENRQIKRMAEDVVFTV